MRIVTRGLLLTGLQALHARYRITLRKDTGRLPCICRSSVLTEYWLKYLDLRSYFVSQVMETLLFKHTLLGTLINKLALKSVSKLIAKWINAVVRKFERKILKRSEPLENMQRKTAVILFSLMMVLIVVNGVSLMHLVGWSVVEGVYVWFVTFTTIGFGDYVPHKPQRIIELSINRSDNHDDKSEHVIMENCNFFTFYFLCVCVPFQVY